MIKTEMTEELRLKTIAMCTDLILEALTSTDKKLNSHGRQLVHLLEKQIEVVYSQKDISDNKSFQECKDKILYNINRHFKL